MGKKIPMQPWFPDTHIADTALLNLEQQGAYRLLLDHMWISGGCLADDDKAIARRLRISTRKWQRLKQQLADYLIVYEGIITQKRLQDDYAYAIKRSADNAKNGGEGGRKTAENWKRLKANATAEDDLFATAKRRSNGSTKHISEVLEKP
jgi:uncharacterized protein YdaU (DUF1376 family)